MKLEALQDIWLSTKAKEVPRFSQEELRKLLSEKSRVEVVQLNRTLRWESGMILLMVVGFVGLMYGMGWGLSIGEWVGLIVFLGVSIRFYWVKYRALNAIPISGDTLKTGIREVLTVLTRYIRFYQVISLLWVPLVSAMSMVYGMRHYAEHQGLDLDLVPLASWLIIGGILLVFAGGMGICAHWYTQRFYQRRLASLQQTLDELEE